MSLWPLQIEQVDSAQIGSGRSLPYDIPSTTGNTEADLALALESAKQSVRGLQMLIAAGVCHRQV